MDRAQKNRNCFSLNTSLHSATSAFVPYVLQLQQMQMAKFFQQGARAGNIMRVPAGQRFTVTVDHQGQLLFQTVESPPETPKPSPVRTSAALSPPESLSAEPPTCKA
jgi:hypothetical protein